MRKILLDFHTDKCKERSKELSESENDFHRMFASVCQLNIKETILFFKGEFIYFEYPSCWQSYQSDCDYLLDVLESSLSKSQDFYKIKKSYNLDDKLRDFRIRGIELNQYEFEINYIYHDNTMKKYAICTRRNIANKLIDNDSLKNDFEQMRKYLLSKNKNYLINHLEELYSNNFVYASEKEIVKSIDHLTKLFNKKVNY